MPSFAATIDLSTLDGSNGFKLSGGAADDDTGHRVAFVGDVNGDGYGDFLVGAAGSDLAGADLGAAYLIYGNAGGFPANLDLTALTDAQGHVFTGLGSLFGFSVGGGMDLNDDGRPDLVVGAPVFAPINSGRGYLIYGQDGDFAGAATSVSTLDGTAGAIALGQTASDVGWDIGSVGDVNGDGIDDVGIMGLSTPTCTAYVLFGRDGGFGPAVNLATLDGTDGFKLTGLQQGASRGVSISGGGDINGDGVGDLIVGGSYGDEGGSNFGAAYVVFGRDTAVDGAFAATTDVSQIDGTNGFAVRGLHNLMNLGYSVASAGDLNGDGFDDFAIGARRADVADLGFNNYGAVFVIFGKDTAVSGAFVADLDLNSLDGSNGFWITGSLAEDRLGSALAAAGDVNGDGLDDLLIGGQGAASLAGAAYVLFGRSGGFDARMETSDLTGANGFRVVGEAVGDNLGMTVSAGDINGDGLSDIILGAYHADPNGTDSGAAYVVYGIQADLTLTGTASDETIAGKSGDDTLYGLSGRDILNGLAGDDVLDGGDMGDLLNGGDGSDDLLGGAGGDLLNGDAGDDSLSGGDAGDKLFGGQGVDTLGGDAGNDRLDGGDGDDVLDGGVDNDLLDGGAGADAMTGGGGNDVFLVDDAGDTTLEGAGEGFDIVRTARDGWVLAANLEGLELQGSADIDGAGNDGTNNLQGNAGANRLDGGAGVDTINGNDGDDIIVGGQGNDLLRGGLGADLFVVGQAPPAGLETDQIFDFSTAEGDSLDLSAAYAGTLILVSAFSKVAGQMTLSFAGGITTVKLDVTGDGKVDYQMKVNGDVTGDAGGWAL